MSNISKPSASGSKPAASAQGAAAGGKLVIPGYIQRKGALRRQDAIERWQKIEHAIHQIYEQNASSLSFQNLYTCAYQIVLHKYGEVLYGGVKSTLKKYIEGVREAIMKKTDEVFLEELLAQWNKHRTAVSMVRDILMYMDRNYVPQNKQLPVFDLGIKLFGQEVFHKQTLDRIQRLIMDIIRKDRDGEVVADRFLLKNLTQMMLEISKKEIYQPCFEQKFLEESKEYFTREAAMFFEKSTAPDYLQKVTQRLREERERAIRCLDSETKPKIEDVLKNVMIDAYKFRIIEKEGSGCTVMLQDWRLDDLKLVYEVLSLVPGALQPCIDLVQNFARAQGYQIVTDKDKEEKPTEMIQECINLREKYEELLNHSFSEKKQGKLQKNAEFQNSAKKAFDDIVNKNERFPEYLSLYVDSKMKKGKTQTAETQFEQLFEQVIALFRHLREKDLFEKYYKSHLARRLLSQRSQSDEAEKGFIARLKAEFGYQFTTKLEGMFQDMRISAESMENFKNHINMGSIQCPIDLSVTVLTTGYWPVTQAVNVAIPDIVTQACNVFKDFYMNAHSGRRLTWQLNMGSADVRANGFDKKYELNVSTFQMCILLLFNEQSSYTYGELLQLTKMPAADLKRNLLALAVKTDQHDKVLEKDKGKTLDNETKFTANNTFKSKLIKVKISPVVIKETTEQVQETMTKVDEERKWQLDAAIVRIMKARKQAEHRELVLEVTKQLQQRFMPSPELIKKRIESLIEREYLERSKESRSKYFYVA